MKSCNVCTESTLNYLLSCQLKEANIRIQQDRNEKAKEDEARNIDAKAEKKDEKAQRIFQKLVRMKPNEDLYSTIQRFERTMNSNCIDRFKWIQGLEHVLEGRHLTNYFANVDSFMGNFDGLKNFLLSHGGFNIHDCVETVLNNYSPNGYLSATQWAMQVSHKLVTILKDAPETAVLVDTLRTISDTLASYFILVPMSRQGRTCVFSTNPPTSHERILAYENFIAPFKSTSRERRSQTYDAKPQFAHPSSYSNERNHHFNRKEKTYYQQANSHRANYKSEHREVFVPTCYNCGEKGHIVP